MADVLIYGAGHNGKFIGEEIARRDRVAGFVDRNEALGESLEIGAGADLEKVRIYRPDEIGGLAYDYIVISVGDPAIKEEVRKALLEAHSVPEEKIEPDYFAMLAGRLKARRTFARLQAALMKERGIRADVAEAGVYRGEFARYLNMCFPESRLYLFDTFSGFPEESLSEEYRVNPGYHFYGTFEDGDEGVALAAMPHPERVIIKKGVFPDTARDLPGQFMFVNLDMDLYAPTLAGLELFWPKMAPGGVILVHDYFRGDLKGIPLAVNEFCGKHGLGFTACSDDCSVVLVKQ